MYAYVVECQDKNILNNVAAIWLPPNDSLNKQKADLWTQFMKQYQKLSKYLQLMTIKKWDVLN